MRGVGDIFIESKEIEYKDKAYCEIKIRNTGSYIPSENLKKVFESFYTENKANGTGLGLAISKKIVELHGGKIWCESDKKKGVVFVFLLPTNSIKDEDHSDFPENSKMFGML